MIIKFRKPKKTEEHEDHLYELADRLSDILDGEDLHDTASVCCLLTACAIMQCYWNPDSRLKAAKVMYKFMKQVIEHENRSDAARQADSEQLSPDHHE